MSAVAFSGLASGLDTGSIVAQLVELKRAPIYRLEDRRKGFQTQLSSLVSLKTKLADMQKAMQDLDTAREFSTLTTSLNKEDFMSVSASSDAAAGTGNDAELFVYDLRGALELFGIYEPKKTDIFILSENSQSHKNLISYLADAGIDAALDDIFQNMN